ncbi:MAG: enoyl-CoA hydratase/isomerase family protein, partial [Acidimicrobiia bacterium]
RVFDNWCNEAGHLLQHATAAEIDAVAEEFVHAGPFFVLNLANGNPIIVETNTLQMEEEGEHYRPAPLFRSVASWEVPGPSNPVAVDAEVAAVIRDRLLGVLFSQTVDISDRAIGSLADLELGCRLALGFKKGPLTLMRESGDTEVERVLGRFGTERKGMPLPTRPLSEYQRFRRHVVVDAINDVVVLTIRRPQALNALDDDVNDELLAVIEEHEHDPSVAGFVITGYGTRSFCAGADIGRFPSMLGDAAASAQYARDCSRLLVHLDAMTKPVVAALNGMALGGGLELAFRCHGIVAHESAWLQLPETTLGIAPGIGAMVVPYHRWPAAAGVFHDMIRAGVRLEAAEALGLGIVDGIAPSAESLVSLAVARVHDLVGEVTRVPDGPVTLPAFSGLDFAASEHAKLDKEVVTIIEQAIVEAAAAPSLTAALEVGYAAFGATACTAAAKERIGAFVSAG